jgi:hypothetical protein
LLVFLVASWIDNVDFNDHVSGHLRKVEIRRKN